MKIKYGKLIDKQFLQDNVLFGRMKKNENFQKELGKLEKQIKKAESNV
mgnify:CR=1 FL=1